MRTTKALVVALIVSASAVGWAQSSPPVLRGRGAQVVLSNSAATIAGWIELVAAFDASLPLDVQAPDTLESLVPRAARVTAREGAVSEVTLRLIRRLGAS